MVLVGAVVSVVVVVVEDAAWVVADGEVRVEDQVRWAASDVDNAWSRVALDVSAGIMWVRVQETAMGNVVVVAWLTGCNFEIKTMRLLQLGK